MAMQCSPPAVCPLLPQRRPYLLLLAASSSLIFLMSLLHFSISTTFSPSTGDQEKQGGYHGYTAEDGKAGNWGLAHSSHVHWRVGRRGGWLRHWFPLPPTLLILWPPPHSAETQLPPDTRLFTAFRPVISRMEAPPPPHSMYLHSALTHFLLSLHTPKHQLRIRVRVSFIPQRKRGLCVPRVLKCNRSFRGQNYSFPARMEISLR